MDHHAYVYIGHDMTVLPPEVSTPGADVDHVVTERLSVADARSLKESAYRRPQISTVRQVVLLTQDFPTDAQNTLLKVLEEPPPDTVFHIVVPQRDMLLATVLSRVSVVEDDENTTSRSYGQEVFAAFSHATYSERMGQIEKAHKAKDIEWFMSLFAGAEKFALTKLKDEVELAERLFQTCLQARGAGASRKMLAEDVALLTPYERNNGVV